MAIMKYLRTGDTYDLQGTCRWLKVPSHVATGKMSGIILEDETGADYWLWIDNTSPGKLRFHTSEPAAETDGTDVAGSNLGDCVMAAVTASLLPSVDTTMDLGSTTKEWGMLWVDEIAHIDDLEAEIAWIGDGATKTNCLKVAASGVITTEGTATINGITLTDNANEIKMTKGTASFEIAAGDTDLIIGAAGSLDIAAAKDVDIDFDLSVTTEDVILDQDLAKATSPTFVGLTLSGAVAGITNISTMTGSIATPTNITMSGYLLMGNDQQIRLGANGATDSYIEFDTATTDLIFYDSKQTGSITLSQLYAGTPLSPIVTGDLTISDGQFDWTNTAGTADVSLWTFANTTTDPIHIVADSITSGSIIKIESSISGQAGYYLECYDGTNQDFLVGDAGAVTIFGVAGSTVHTITSGDAVISDGSLAITDNDDAAALTIINNTITTGDLISVTADAMTSGSMLYLDNAVGATFSGMYIQCFDGAANDFDVKLHGVTTIAGVASGTDALTLTAGDIKLTAGLVELTLGDVLLTDGMVTADTIQNLQSYVKRNSASAAAPAFVVENTNATGTGYAMLITQDASSGASGGLSITNKGTSPILSLTATAARTGYVLDIPMANQLGERGVYVNGAYTGAANEGAIEVASTGALIAGGNLLRLSSAGNNAQNAYIAEIAVTAGTIAGATDGFCLQIDDDSVGSSSYAVNIDSASNEALKVTTGDVLFGEFLTVTKGLQASAAALTATVTTGVATPPGTSFVDLTVNVATHIVDLPAPVIGNVIYYVANGANAFELGPDTTTTYINGTLADAAKTLTCAASGVVIQAVCSVTDRWVVTQISATGVPTGGGTPA